MLHRKLSRHQPRIPLALSALLIVALAFVTACGTTAAPQIIEKQVIVEKVVVKEVPVEKIVVVEKEVVKQVVKEVPVEVVREVPVEVVKEVTVVVEKIVVATPAAKRGAPAKGGRDDVRMVMGFTPPTINPYLQGGLQPFYDIVPGAAIVARLDLLDHATSGFTGWEIVDTSNWKLFLREGVKFHNGEDWNAEAAKFSFDLIGDKAFGSPLHNLLGATETTVLGKNAIQVHCIVPCPIFPRFAQKVPFQAPKWYQTASDQDKAQSQIYGWGPYQLVEHRIGQFLKAEAYPDYVPVPGLFEAQLPILKEFTLFFRSEKTVRKAMLLAGEVDWVESLDIEDIDDVPDFRLEETGRIYSMAIDTLWHPALKKKKVRQALAHALDCDTMAQAFSRGVATCHALMSPPWVFGIDEKIDQNRYEYDPKLAEQLLKEAGYNNELIELNVPAGKYPRGEEVAESVVTFWQDIGVNAELKILETGIWKKYHKTGPGRLETIEEVLASAETLTAPKPLFRSPHVVLSVPNNDSMDFGRQVAFFFNCNAIRGKYCSADLQKISEAAIGAAGEERKKRLGEAARFAHDQVFGLYLFELTNIYALDDDLNWNQGVGGSRWFINTMSWAK